MYTEDVAKFDYRKLSVDERTKVVGELLDILYAAKDRDVLHRFLLQLLTPSETVMLARRWQIAQRLAIGESYYKISRELKVGMSTIESVDHWLSDAIGDYRKRIEEEHAKEQRKRRRGHGHALLFPATTPYLLLNLLAEGILHMWAAEVRRQDERNKQAKH